MIRRLGYPLAFLALFAVAGGHWAVLQTVAWAGMIVDHVRSVSISQAVATTFDGAHPCPLCLKVEQGKKQEEKIPALAKADQKAEGFLPAAVFVFRSVATVAASWPRPTALSASARGDAPPVPPPRLLLPA